MNRSIMNVYLRNYGISELFELKYFQLGKHKANIVAIWLCRSPFACLLASER